MSNNDAILSELRAKVERLIQLYESSQKEVSSLKNEIQIVQQKMQVLQEDNNKLTEELRISKIANAIHGDSEESRRARKRLDQIVREIDKCITLLDN